MLNTLSCSLMYYPIFVEITGTPLCIAFFVVANFMIPLTVGSASMMLIRYIYIYVI